MAQIEFASVVVVNKCDLISKEALLRVKQTVRAINADASIIESVNSKIGEVESELYTIYIVTFIQIKGVNTRLNLNRRINTSHAKPHICTFMYIHTYHSSIHTYMDV